MKNKNIYIKLCLAIGLFAFVSCDKNEIVPDYQKVGESTATVATLGASQTSVVPASTVTFTLNYVNLPSDPVESIILKAKVGENEYVELQTFDESAAATGQEHTRTATYTVPNVASKTKIIVDMVINSQKEFPQVERSTLTIQ